MLDRFRDINVYHVPDFVAIHQTVEVKFIIPEAKKASLHNSNSICNKMQ